MGGVYNGAGIGSAAAERARGLAGEVDIVG